MAASNSLLRNATLKPHGLSKRAIYRDSTSDTWSLIWEAGPYYQSVSQQLEKARSYAIFVGWQIDSRLELDTEHHETFKDLILRLVTQKPTLHIYFLVWDYAYFYVFERELMQLWVWDNLHERVHFIFDNRHPYGGSHHEKLVIVDGETAFVGGVDICNDRWDTSRHLYADPRRSLKHDGEEHSPYHDLSVKVRGQVVANLVEYIRERWEALSSVRFPSPSFAALAQHATDLGAYRVLISRTQACMDLRRPLLIRETEFLFRDLIRNARHQLVIENQYFWSRLINHELMTLMKNRAGSGLKIFIVLPSCHGGSLAFRMMGTHQSRLLDQLASVADDTGTRLTLGCPFVRSKKGDDEKHVYVHSKIIVVDDRFMAVGSSNFNNRGFRMDTELTLTLVGNNECSRQRIRHLTDLIVGHWGTQAYHGFFGRDPWERAGPGFFEPHLYLKPYQSAWAAYHSGFQARVSRKLPLKLIFDPSIPILFFIKTRLAACNSRRLRRLMPFLLFSSFILSSSLVLFSISLLSLVAGQRWDSEELIWVIAFSALLCSAWIFPWPVAIITLIAGLQLGWLQSAMVVGVSLAIAGIWGYTTARLLPTLARRIYGNAPGSRQTEQAIGLRRFPVLISMVLDPSIPFRVKIAYQGIYSIPWRWFAFTLIALVIIHAALAGIGGLIRIR